MSTEELFVGDTEVGSGRSLEVSMAYPRFGHNPVPLVYFRLVRKRSDGTRSGGAVSWIAIDASSAGQVIELLKTAAEKAAAEGVTDVART